MASLLGLFTDRRSLTFAKWMPSSFQVAVAQHCGYTSWARWLRTWTRDFINNKKIPENPYGKWMKCYLEDEDLEMEIVTHLQSIGDTMKARDIVDYLRQPEVLEQYGMMKMISERTAQRWLSRMGYQWSYTKKGQYVDGHEWVDVMKYRQESYIPRIKKLEERMRTYSSDGVEEQGPQRFEDGKWVVLWFHDESTFYANDQQRKHWIQENETAKPYAKGEGASLMAVDFVSADYGWLRSQDQKRSTQWLFRAGKACDGYYTNANVVKHAEDAMAILLEDYPDEEHVLIFDNATTHVKRAYDALCARNMPKKPSAAFKPLINVEDKNGKPVYGPDGKILKIRAQM